MTTATAAGAAAYLLVAGLWWSWFDRDYERHTNSPTRGYRDIQDFGVPVWFWLALFALVWPLTASVFATARVLRGQR